MIMSDKNNPIFSIIVAVFNGAETIQHCIDSITNQSYSNYELIIIDGGSLDGTVELLEKNQDHITYWVTEPDSGIYNAWNKGLRQAKGEWVCFLGADDYLWESRTLEKISESLVKISSDIRIVYSRIMLLNNDGQAMYPIGESWLDVKERFKSVMCIPHPGVMHRHILFHDNGFFDESFRISGDYELLLRELKTHDAVFLPDIIATGMRLGGISSTPQNSLRALQETRRAQKLHGQSIPGWTWVSAMTRVYVRLLLWRLFGESLTRKLLDSYRRKMGLPSHWTNN